MEDKYELFTYATKSEKPYEALLFGLDKQDPQKVKTQLLHIGLKCLDVKLVVKKSPNYPEFIILSLNTCKSIGTFRKQTHLDTV